jgi:hypothetical protein
VDKLDATYSLILNWLIDGRTETARRSLVAKFQKLIGSIILLAEPLGRSLLTYLLGIESEIITSKLLSLHSVLSIPSSSDSPIRMLYLSFRNFLVNPEKCSTNPFWVDKKEGHRMLAMKCLKQISRPGCL